MKKKEKYLLGIYLELQYMNPELVALTGSLLLAFKGIEKRRTAQDIDVISPNPSKVVINNNFREAGHEVTGSDDYCRKIIHIPTGTKIDILSSEEQIGKSINYNLEVFTGNIQKMWDAKERYHYNDGDDDIADKHCKDLNHHFKEAEFKTRKEQRAAQERINEEHKKVKRRKKL